MILQQCCKGMQSSVVGRILDDERLPVVARALHVAERRTQRAHQEANLVVASMSLQVLLPPLDRNPKAPAVNVDLEQQPSSPSLVRPCGERRCQILSGAHMISPPGEGQPSF